MLCVCIGDWFLFQEDGFIDAVTLIVNTSYLITSDTSSFLESCSLFFPTRKFILSNAVVTLS